MIYDNESRNTLPGASITVLGSNPLQGTTSDFDGKFNLKNVALGRVDLLINYLGYEEKIISNLLVTAGKEIILEVKLVESYNQLREVEILGNKKTDVRNDMSLISSKSFSVDETKRYAGSLNDPARMVSSYAGVSNDAGGRNDIIVRGNSPKGILWKLEGIEIPNPNHFSSEGSTGGPISALNSNMLSNSDFFTGAFAPEYGNASSGVLDMKLRNGNNLKREHSIGIGLLGVDATTEGPLSKENGSSYLANYRYSSLDLLNNLGVVNFYGIPKYQDGSFKLLLPTKKWGVISVFGLGGLNSISVSDTDSDDPDKIYANGVFSCNLGVIGVNQILTVSERSFIKNSISVSSNGGEEEYNYLEGQLMELRFKEDQQRTVYRFGTSFNTKLNSRHSFKFGGNYSINTFSFKTKSFEHEAKEMITTIDKSGHAGLMQSFASWKFRITEDLTLVSGLHSMHFLLNHSHSIEPRAALKYKLNEKQSLSAGYGKHSKLEPLTLYFSNTNNPDGTITNLNRYLELSKAHHFVLGYQNHINSNLLFKTEIYYQNLYNVPVENNSNSSFSMINSKGEFTTHTLVNEGYGRNYGIELTLEKYFDNKYYYLLTGSLYQSEYKTLDNTWRNTMFNGNYTANFLFGKEFELNGKSKKRTLGISTKITFAGGQRYSPINLEESIKQDSPVRDENNSFSSKGDDLLIANLKIYYRKDYKGLTHEISIDIQNVTNQQGKLAEDYNSRTKSIEHYRQASMLPDISYKVYF